MVWFTLRSLERIRDDLEQTKTREEPRQTKAHQYQQDVLRNKDILNEFHSWNTSRVEWHKYLADFQQIVSTNIQITAMMVRDDITIVDGSPARAGSMTLRGVARGPDPKGDVDSLWKLAERSEYALRANVQQFTEVPGARSTDRQFVIEVTFRPRKF